MGDGIAHELGPYRPDPGPPASWPWLRPVWGQRGFDPTVLDDIAHHVVLDARLTIDTRWDMLQMVADRNPRGRAIVRSVLQACWRAGRAPRDVQALLHRLDADGLHPDAAALTEPASDARDTFLQHVMAPALTPEDRLDAVEAFATRHGWDERDLLHALDQAAAAAGVVLPRELALLRDALRGAAA